MAQDDRLRRYRGKRDFAKTGEPGGRRGSHGGARSKGPSTDPRDKRLAVPTEDHPLEYATFEGVIPEGEYGAGPVLVWDAGSHQNTTERNGDAVSMADGLDRGHVTFVLHGEKLTGGYSLSRFRTGRDESWLLVKARDDRADARRAPVRTQPESVRSGGTLDDVVAEDSDE